MVSGRIFSANGMDLTELLAVCLVVLFTSGDDGTFDASDEFDWNAFEADDGDPIFVLVVAAALNVFLDFFFAVAPEPVASVDVAVELDWLPAKMLNERLLVASLFGGFVCTSSLFKNIQRFTCTSIAVWSKCFPQIGHSESESLGWLLSIDTKVFFCNKTNEEQNGLEHNQNQTIFNKETTRLLLMCA